MAAGRKSKFESMKKVLYKLAEKGFTDVEMAEIIGVTERTINNWKKKDPEFFQSLKDWKLKADEEIEKSLYQRAKGYVCIDTKFATHEGKITDSKEYLKHYPPDTVAAIYWLKNRKPEEWRDKPDAKGALGELLESLKSINDLAELINNPAPNRSIDDE